MNNRNKLTAVLQLKWLCISTNKAIMIGPFLTIGMVILFRLIYGSNTNGTLPPVLTALLLNLGLSMNLCSDGFSMVGTSIAEEKEKHTLRALMTSSVTGVQYFIGSIFFPFLFTVAVNFAIIFVCDAPVELLLTPAFLLISMVAALISCIIGMIIGICAKDQMNANLIAYPLMMVFMLIPILGDLSTLMNKISAFLFTGVVTKMANSCATGTPYSVTALDLSVLFGELIISILIFLLLYKRNGYEKD